MSVHYECRAVQNHAGNISAQRVTSLLAGFVVVLVLGTQSGPPGRLTLQYQTISSGVTLKARYTKHVLPIVMT
jgi:hypothetical protein